MGYSLAADKYTDLVPSGTSRLIYVSTSGNDANDGLTPSTPKRTHAAGYGLLRGGFDDHLLQRYGDVFDYTGSVFPNRPQDGLPSWKKSGKNATERMVLGAYGDTSLDRPKIRISAGNGNDLGCFFAAIPGGGLTTMNHVALQSWEVESVSTGTAGIYIIVGSSNLLIEDVKIQRFAYGMVMQGDNAAIDEFDWRRCVIVDNKPADHTSGIYMSHGKVVRYHNNFLDNNGPADIFSHGMYFDDSKWSGFSYEGRDNIVCRSGSHGIQCRPGGVAWNNLFIDNPIGLQLGSGGLEGGTDMDPIEPLVARANHNVVIGGGDINANNPRGFAYVFAGISSGWMRDCLAVHGAGGYRKAIQFDARGTGTFNMSIENNVWYNHGGDIAFEMPQSEVAGIRLWANDVQNTGSVSPMISHLVAGTRRAQTFSGGVGNNRFWSTANQNGWADAVSFSAWKTAVGDTTSTAVAVTYTSPSNNIDSWMKSIGVMPANATLAQCKTEYFNRIRAIRRYSRDERFADPTFLGDHIRVGLDKATLGTSTPVAPTANAGADQLAIVDTDRSGGEAVTLVGSGTAPGAAIQAYIWKEGAVTLSSGINPTLNLTNVTGGNHTYTLQTVSTNGLSSPIDSVSVRVSPNTVTGFAITPQVGGLGLSCTAYTSATLYRWRYGTSAGALNTVVTTLVNSLTLTGLTPGQTYFAEVQVELNGVAGGWSSTLNAVPQALPNTAPTVLANNVDVIDSDRNGSETVTLSASATDPDSDPIQAYEWKRGTQIVGTTATINPKSVIGVHNYTVRAQDSRGAWSTAVSPTVIVRPAAPNGVMATTDVSQATLSCTLMQGVTNYLFEMGTSTGDYNLTPVNSSTPSTTVKNLTGGSTLYFRITPSGGGATGTPSAEQSIVIASPVNQAPVANGGADVDVTDTDGDGVASVTLSGSASTDDIAVTGYSWRRDNEVVDSDVTYGPTNWPVGVNNAILTVTDAGGKVSEPDEVIVTVRPKTPTAGLSATPAVQGGTLNLTAITGAITYTFRYGTTSGLAAGTYTEVTTTTNSLVLTGLTGSTLHYWIVRANGPGCSGAFSAQQSFTTQAAVSSVAAPTSVTLTGQDATISINWVNGAEGTLAKTAIYKSRTTGGPYTKVGEINTPGTNFLDTDDVPANQTRYYVLRAVLADGTESVNSTQVAGSSIVNPSAVMPSTTPPVKVTNSAETPLFYGQVDAYWPAWFTNSDLFHDPHFMPIITPYIGYATWTPGNEDAWADQIVQQYVDKAKALGLTLARYPSGVAGAFFIQNLGECRPTNPANQQLWPLDSMHAHPDDLLVQYADNQSTGWNSPYSKQWTPFQKAGPLVTKGHSDRIAAKLKAALAAEGLCEPELMIWDDEIEGNGEIGIGLTGGVNVGWLQVALLDPRASDPDYPIVDIYNPETGLYTGVTLNEYVQLHPMPAWNHSQKFDHPDNHAITNWCQALGTELKSRTRHYAIFKPFKDLFPQLRAFNWKTVNASNKADPYDAGGDRTIYHDYSHIRLTAEHLREDMPYGETYAFNWLSSRRENETPAEWFRRYPMLNADRTRPGLNNQRAVAIAAPLAVLQIQSLPEPVVFTTTQEDFVWQCRQADYYGFSHRVIFMPLQNQTIGGPRLTAIAAGLQDVMADRRFSQSARRRVTARQLVREFLSRLDLRDVGLDGVIQ